MRPLVWALVAFLVAVSAQLVVWRTRRPAGQYMGLLALCLAVLAVSLGGLYALSFPTAVEYVNFLVLYVALFLAYMTTYSAVEGDSPTMAVLLRIEQAGAAGLVLKEMLDGLNDQVLVVERLNDLVTASLVRCEGGRYLIASRGALMARIYAGYRALLRMEKGG